MGDVSITCRRVSDPGARRCHDLIRHQTFVVEQGLFESTDQDEHDADPDVRHVLALVDGEPAGTVRLYRVPPMAPDEELWKGDRLAVLPQFRHVGIGAPLVHHAVADAAADGGDRMIAWVQPANVVFFTRLGWSAEGEPADYLGSLHQHMSIGLQ